MTTGRRFPSAVPRGLPETIGTPGMAGPIVAGGASSRYVTVTVPAIPCSSSRLPEWKAQ
jgi:hypothetical protein